MSDILPFGTTAWWWMFLSLFAGRGSDLLSTWLATPTLLLEANPIARWLGWKRAVPLNLGLCIVFAFFPLPGVILATSSALVAARNFQQAWLMRTLGEEHYRRWHMERLQEASMPFFLLCLLSQNGLVAAVGLILAWSSIDATSVLLLPFGIGVGIAVYAAIVTFYTLLALRRIRFHPV